MLLLLCFIFLLVIQLILFSEFFSLKADAPPKRAPKPKPVPKPRSPSPEVVISVPKKTVPKPSPPRTPSPPKPAKPIAKPIQKPKPVPVPVPVKKPEIKKEPIKKPEIKKEVVKPLKKNDPKLPSSYLEELEVKTTACDYSDFFLYNTDLFC